MSKTFNTGTRGGNLHKDGIYQAEIQEAEVTVSQKSGNDMIKVQLAIFKDGQQRGNIVIDFLTMTDTAEWRWHQLMDALDAPSNVDIDPEVWLPGKTVWVNLETQEYNDEDQNKVKSYMNEAKAMKKMAKENGGVLPDVIPNDSGNKAKSRNRANSNAPELSSEERMPL